MDTKFTQMDAKLAEILKSWLQSIELDGLV
jgi:hypothetical protein